MNGIFWTDRQATRPSDAFNFMSETGPPPRPSNPPFRIMDVWPMSVKRADAHRGEHLSSIDARMTGGGFILSFVTLRRRCLR
jgi:hypothetical protein